MLEQLRNFKTRKAIAKAFTKQCDMGDIGVGVNDVQLTSTKHTKDGSTVTFTINGKDGALFTTIIEHGIFGESYVNLITPVVPTYDHEVYFITKELIGNALYASSRAIKDTTMTRFEWIKSLHDDGVLDKAERTLFCLCYPKMIEGQWEFSNLGHPIFDTYKEASKYATNANFGNVMKDAMAQLDEALMERPTPVEVWGIKPLSKEPVLLGTCLNGTMDFTQICSHLKQQGVGITLERDFLTRAYFFYNGRPVFTSKEAAQHCIDIEFGCCERQEEIAKIIDRLLNTKQITKVSDIKCFNQLASVIGKGQAQVELFKVMHNESCWVDIDVDDFALALDWALTPQGYDYWESLYVHIRKAKESNRNGCKSQ